MAKDKDKSANSSAPGSDDDNDIPLLEAIVVPGNTSRVGKAKLTKKKRVAAPEKPAAKETSREPEATAQPVQESQALDDIDMALDDLDTALNDTAGTDRQAAGQTDDLAGVLREAFQHDIRQIISQIVEHETEAVLNRLEPFLTQNLLPQALNDLLKPELNKLYEELKNSTQNIEQRTKERIQNRAQTLEGQLAEFREKLLEATAAPLPAIDSLGQRLEALNQRFDDIAGGARQGDAEFKQAAADLKRTVDERMALLKDAIERRVTQKITDSLSTVLADQVEAKLATFANQTTGALQEQLASTVTDLGEMLNDAIAPIDSLSNRLDKLQNEFTAFRDDIKKAQEKSTDNKQFRKEIDAMRAERDAILQELEDRFDRAFLRRVAALPKMVANITRAYAGPGAKIGVQLDAAERPTKKDKLNQDASTSMEKTYDPSAIETRWYDTWEKQNYFAPRGDGPSYCIMIPPPNVTGSLHMGHAFQDTIMDALTRYHRMMGFNTLWQAGTDHAGIATQMVVERQLAAQSKSRHDLGREAFIKKVWQWKNESGGTITRQLRRLGASLDWSRERFTMDTGLSKAVREVFVRLYEEGLIYRGKRLVNWDPVLHTAVSDLEVVSQEEDGSLWHIRYPLAESDEYIVVATTRPETMLGDAAVAVHPDDERYKHLIGRIIDLPLANRRIPIIADTYVDPSFGTGCVKITPAHDFNDYQVWGRHREASLMRTVPFSGLINIFTKDAKIKASREDDDSMHRAGAKENGSDTAAASAGPRGPATFELIPERYRGLDRFEARKRIVADLEAQNYLEKTDKHRLMVPRGDRSGAVVEPLLTDQWFVRAEPLAGPAIKAVETGKIKFVPESWANTYYDWMRNIQDWCISRQIWWGHRVPAWYDRRGNVYVGRSEAEVRKANDLPSMVPLVQDPDVLDTWFSSALWPFSTLGWPEQTPELKTFYPTSVLVTGFDIIFFWVARMIMMGLKFTGEVPFKEVYIHGLVRDSHGQKMSKSKGNVLDPIDLIDGIDLPALVNKRTTGLMQPDKAPAIEKATQQEFPGGIPSYGTDALRFTFAALASTGRDIRFDLGRTEGYRNFCNKLWNAARYVLMNTENEDTGARGGEMDFSLADRWITSRLQLAVQNVQDAMSHYRFDVAANAIYEFVWNEYCDWYLELSKPVLQNKKNPPALLRGTRFTLVNVLETLLRMAHPIIPFITEEIWQRVAPLTGRKGDTIMLQPYPKPDTDLIDAKAVSELEWVKEFVLGVRKIRGEMNIPPGKTLNVLLQNSTDEDRRRFDRNEPFVMALARLGSVEWLDLAEQAPESATALVGQLKILIPMAGLIDKEAEVARLTKELDRLRKELIRAEAKLSNRDFVDRAPPDVVDKERNRVKELRLTIKNLDEQLLRIEAL